MPNYCLNEIVFYTEHEDLSELRRLHGSLLRLWDACPAVADAQENRWLGNVAQAHGMDSQAHFCRGYINEVGEINENNLSFLVRTTTAWEPLSELWAEVCKSYSGVMFVHCAEESGNDIYINTDTEGKFIPRRYKINVCSNRIDQPLPKGYFVDGMQACDVFGDDTYYANFDELLKHMEEITGKTFYTLAEIEMHLQTAFAALNLKDGSVSVHEFDYA